MLGQNADPGRVFLSLPSKVFQTRAHSRGLGKIAYGANLRCCVYLGQGLAGVFDGGK
jgi:hypothetical protein